jgi:tetratricopeptide (TPR) repeat protein
MMLYPLSTHHEQHSPKEVETVLKRIGLLVACALLLFISWSAVLNMRSPLEKQAELIALADAEIANGTYANAEPFLLEAASYNTQYAHGVLERLKTVYLSLGAGQEYADVLKAQTGRADCPVAAYEEYALLLLADGDIKEALPILKTGVQRTRDSGLLALYERERYAFTAGRERYEDVTAYHNGGIQVMNEGLWGLAGAGGNLRVPCEYGQISTYDTADGGRVVVMRSDGSIVAVNLKNQMVAKTDLRAEEVGNLSEGIVSLRLANGKWIIADGKLVSNGAEYEGIGTCTNSALAVMSNGRWGVAGVGGGKSVLPNEYDSIAMDELGRCYAQKAVFARANGATYLFVDGKQVGEAYEDALPFTDDGWAAAKKNGKWGFVDLEGRFVIEPSFDEALSFSGHLAAVRQGELWGYVALTGRLAIEPQFLMAKSFYSGRAPVLTEDGYCFISLVEALEGGV